MLSVFRPSFLISRPAKASLLASVVFLAGCAVGPDFAVPPAPDVMHYDSAATPESTSDQAQKFQSGRDIPSQWWGVFRSPALNDLVEQSVKGNPDLAAADASLRVAQSNLAAGRSELFPSVSAGFSSQRERSSAASSNGYAPSMIYTLHNASVNVSYGIDVFGGTRRAIEELQAQADQAGFQKEAAYLSLTGNVVTAAIQEASLRDQIEAARAVVTDQEKILKILQVRQQAGGIAKSAVATQKATLASARATVPPLEHQLAVTRHLLSVLVGHMPQQAPNATFHLSDLRLPPEIPLSLPSKLVEQRPDVQAAQENLHAASAAIGVAEAARLPEIALSADIGSMANVLSKLFSPGGGFWSLGGSVTQSIFDAGSLADKEDSARATFDVSAAQYRKTVLTAFQDVADTLHALQSDADTLTAKQDAENAASESLTLAKSQFDYGAIGFSDLLLSETTKQQTTSALVQAKAQRYADTAALFVALGGGWWNRDKTGVLIGDNVIVSDSLMKGVP